MGVFSFRLWEPRHGGAEFLYAEVRSLLSLDLLDNVTFQSACWEQVIGYPGILSNFRPRLGKGRKLPCIKLLFLPSAKRFSASKKCFLEGIDLVAGVVSCRTTHHKGRSTSQVNWRIAILPTDIILSLHVFVAAFFLPILSTNFLHLES